MKTKQILFIILINLFGFVDLSSLNAQADFIWFDGKNPITYSIPKNASPVVKSALEMWKSDMQQVTGQKPVETSDKRAVIKIVQTDTIDKKEAFRILVQNDQILVIGSDARGTAYGILELSRLAGVSPWTWWGDVTPEKKTVLTLPAGFTTMQSPSVEFRGIFLNDEDWGLMPWASKTFEPNLEPIKGIRGVIGPKSYEKIFQLLLRLRANAIWPAMHECTTPFYLVEGNREMAERYGIVLGASHCEPLMSSATREWNYRGTGSYNFIENQKNVLLFWETRLKELGNSENIFTVGMRGKHDGLMEGVRTLEEHKQALSEIIPVQRELLKKYIHPNIEKVPQVFVPYKEVLDVYNAGLSIPDDVTLMWCDDNHGYIHRLSNKDEQERSGGAGVYYHISYLGKPHDYLWLASTSPALIYTEMNRAYEHGARKLWILNVGDIKPAEHLMEYFLDLAWNIQMQKQTPNNVFATMQEYYTRDFGAEYGKEISGIMTEYYRLANFRKPEHSGWNRIEENGYPRGNMPVQPSEYSGKELQRRIDDYQKLARYAKELAKKIPQNLQSAYFELIEYPVVGAADINQKWLYWKLYETLRISSSANDTIEALNYKKKSLDAFAEIENYTDKYNMLENGKWNKMMSFKPRNLFVFRNPSDTSISNFECLVRLDSQNFVTAKNAVESPDLTDKNAAVFGLGHSFNAVQMQKGQTLTYEFDLQQTGEDGWIKIALIPNHDVDGNGLKIEVKMNGENPQTTDYSTRGRSEQWRQNTLRGQAIVSFPQKFEKSGKITISIKALTDNVILDQIAIGNGAMDFYEFPVRK